MLSLREGLLNKENIKNIKNLNHNKATFNKKSLECGTIVGFEDGTLGVYVDGKMAEYIENKFNFSLACFLSDNQYFLTHTYGGSEICYEALNNFDNDLRYENRNNDQCDITRIYYDILSDKEIKKLTRQNFHTEIFRITDGMSYIER